MKTEPTHGQRTRRWRLGLLAEFHRLLPGADYDYKDVAERLAGKRIERYAVLSEDETYAFVEFVETLPEGERSLTESTGQPTGGNPIGILDLDTWVLYPPVIKVEVDRKGGREYHAI